jgi:hypothetical protein
VHTTLLRLNTAALDLAEFDITGPQANPLQFFIFGPRDLYRPGETVLLNGLLRDQDGKPVKAQPVSVEVRRPDEQVSRKFVWEADANGLYHTSCNWPPRPRPAAGNCCSTWAAGASRSMNSSSKTSCPSAWRWSSRAATPLSPEEMRASRSMAVTSTARRRPATA